MRRAPTILEGPVAIENGKTKRKKSCGAGRFHRMCNGSLTFARPNNVKMIASSKSSMNGGLRGKTERGWRLRKRRKRKEKKWKGQEVPPTSTPLMKRDRMGFQEPTTYMPEDAHRGRPTRLAMGSKVPGPAPKNNRERVEVHPMEKGK